MVKHIILWQLKEELSAEEKANIKKEIKSGLEALVGKNPGTSGCECADRGSCFFQCGSDAGFFF